MIDFINCWVTEPDAMAQLSNDNRFYTISKKEYLNKRTGEYKTEEVKEFNGITLTTNIYYDGLYYHKIKFKPHYYFNDGVHNANDFTFQDFLIILHRLKNILGIDLVFLLVKGIEFGVNFLSPIDCKFLIALLEYHDKNRFVNHTGLKYSKFSAKPKNNGKYNKCSESENT